MLSEYVCGCVVAVSEYMFLPEPTQRIPVVVIRQIWVYLSSLSGLSQLCYFHLTASWIKFILGLN